MWNIKKKKEMNITKQKQTHRCRKQMNGYHSGEERKRGKMGIQHQEIQTTTYKIDKDILYSIRNYSRYPVIT